MAGVTLVTPSDDLMRLTGAALAILKAIYKPGFRYIKAGVMFVELLPATVRQFDLFEGRGAPQSAARAPPRQSHLMALIDTVNSKQGRGTLRLASAGVNSAWDMKRDYITPGYTTRWDELPIAWV